MFQSGAKLVAAACVKNEVDIVEPFVRHTLAFVDRLIVLDNGSQDGTRAVLAALQAERLALEVIDDSSLGKYHADRSTRLMREAAGHHGADWVVMLDADEFLASAGVLPPQGADPTRPLALPWRTYVPDDGDDAAELNPARRLGWRLVEEPHPHAKLIVPRTLALDADARLENGSHRIFLGAAACEAIALPTAHLAHFPIRSAGQYRVKIATNYLQYQAMPDRHLGWGWHYRAPFLLLKRDPRGFDRALRSSAEDYSSMHGPRPTAATVRDPLAYRGGPLRYTPDRDDEAHAWRVVLDLAETLAGRHAALAALLEQERERSVSRQVAFTSDIQAQWDRRDAELSGLVRNFEYEYWPRGRIVFDRENNSFTLYADRKLMRDDVLAAIRRKFCISEQPTSTKTDFHYQSSWDAAAARAINVS